MKNYYEILEINNDASKDEIKKAFRLKAIKYHPDKHFGDNYFATKFIEIREAYDILSDVQEKAKYDVIYKVTFLKEEPLLHQTIKEERRNEKEKEEQFFYDPHKHFYSFKDRTQADTPQFNPNINHWGDPFPSEADFFALPKRIGKIISAYTNLSKVKTASNGNSVWKSFKRISLIAISCSALIIIFFRIQDLLWIGIWTIAPLALFSLIVWFPSKPIKFKYTCNFIGVNGFAEYKCEEDRNIVSSYEINFNDITDLIRIGEVHKSNFQYICTSYYFIWLNKNRGILEVKGEHTSKEDNPSRFCTDFWLNTFAERYWTVYLLDNLENELEGKGYLQFNLYFISDKKYIQVPYIQLGIGYIKFITAKGDVTYNFNEIKRVYYKGTDLFIEHTNYDKKFFFFESGNKNGIPLMNLSNRQFFFRAMELLLGYKFS